MNRSFEVNQINKAFISSAVTHLLFKNLLLDKGTFSEENFVCVV